MYKNLVFLLIGTIALLLDTLPAVAQSPPIAITEFQYIRDLEPVGGKYKHEYTFWATAQTQVGDIYYELSFFDSSNRFIGYCNGIPDLSNGAIRCNGSAYLSGIAARYEIKWEDSDGPLPSPLAAFKKLIEISDFQSSYDTDLVNGEFRNEFTFVCSGPTDLGKAFYEIAFFDSSNRFIGYSNGFANFSSGSARISDTAYLRGTIGYYAISW